MSVSAFPYANLIAEYISADDETILDLVFSPADARAGVQYETDGDTTARRNSGNLNLTDWLTPKTAAPGAYEIRCNSVGDALTAGSAALNTWLALTSQRHWEVEETGIGTVAATLTIDFRLAGSAILKTVTVNITATVEV